MRLGDARVFVLLAGLTLLGSSCHPAPVSAPAPAPMGTPLEGGEPYDEAPVPVTLFPHIYPESAKEASITGTVVVQVLIGKDGRVKNWKVVRGVSGLNEAAVEAARRSVFKPALKDGKPIFAWYEMPYEFPPPERY